MKKIRIFKSEESSFRFILNQFIETHEEDRSIYSQELSCAETIIKELNSQKN